MNRKIFMVSLGCPKNQVDAERAMWALRRAGAEPAGSEREADAIIVNTCGFIEAAKEESINTILSLARVKEEKPGVTLAVMGCLSERYREELSREIPEIDHIFGAADLAAVVEKIAPAPPSFIPDPDAGPREISTAAHWAYLKIAEGCSNKCSFCVIPSIRGPYRSRTAESLISEAQALARGGVKELILVAQDTTLYGADIRMKDGLSGLLRSLAKIGGLEWVRVLYMYPSLISDGLLDVFAAEEKIAPYFDLPLQHASDRVLKNMLRPETDRSIRRLIEKIRKKIPHAALRASFITGFPGETEEDFKTLMRLVEDAKFDHAGCFTYSPEEGTAAFGMAGAVKRKTAMERREALMRAQRKISKALMEEKEGKIFGVMVDGGEEGEPLLTGRLMTQAPKIDGQVILDSVAAAPGEIIPVLITGSLDYDLIGTAPAKTGAAG